MTTTENSTIEDGSMASNREQSNKEALERMKWSCRRLRLFGRRFGAIKTVKDSSIPLQDVQAAREMHEDEDTVDFFSWTANVSDWFDLFRIGEKPLGLAQLRRIAWKETKIWPPKFTLKPEPESETDGRLDPFADRRYGIGIVGEVSRREFDRHAINLPMIKEQLENMSDFRPFFTYWISFVHVVIMIFAVSLFGFGPLGFGLSHKSNLILTEWLTMEQVEVMTPANAWIGPDLSDLVKIGALFTPCMRKMTSIEKRRNETSFLESNESGCCVRNDGSGCVQTTESNCSPFLSTFYKWNPDKLGPDGRKSGPVCDLDPQYCASPVSNGPQAWPDDISKWPVCWKTNPEHDKFGAPRHMRCKVTAKPCCVGIHGQCELRSEDYCNFVGGTLHPEASLCSQVSCMGDVCGMIPFNETPNQLYRIFTSLFINAGLIQLVIVLAFQLLIMRDVEKLCGSIRIALIFFTSGMIGNLVSAMFTPFRPECGPSGALFGIMGTLVAEVVKAWALLKTPIRALFLTLMPVGIFTLCGFLPWVDNYAHLSGFITGLLLSYALLPHIHTSEYDKRLNKIIKVLLLVLVLCIFLGLLIVFYVVELSECDWCKLLSCIPFTRDFCAEMNINFERRQRLF